MATITYLPLPVHVTFDIIAVNHLDGDYVTLHSDDTDGSVDYATPVNGMKYNLFSGGVVQSDVTAIDGAIIAGYTAYGFNAYDSKGNIHAGTPDEESAWVFPIPKQPSTPSYNYYSNESDLLVLTL